jgi:hypothetical protein
MVACIEDCKRHTAFGARVLVCLWMLFQVLIEVKERTVALKAVIASEDCLSSHQLNAMVLADVRTVLYRPHKFSFAETAQVGRDLIFAHPMRSFPLFGVQVQFTSTVDRAMIPESLK